MGKKKDELAVVVPEVKLPKAIQERLKSKMLDRNEDLILDCMEQIHIHQSEIRRLAKKIKVLSEGGYVDEDL